MRVLMIDNYDSFTYNLVQYLQELGAEVLTRRNDQITIPEMEALGADRLMVSPGPCTPNEAGISLEAIRHFAGRLPILGVCLGHQALGQAFGGKVVRAGTVMHGKTSPIYHNGEGIFRGLPSPYIATRYHSLVLEKSTLPDCFAVTAWTEDAAGGMEEIMGIRHRTLPVEGVQYHPESILTEHGYELLDNFLKGNDCTGTLFKGDKA